VKKIALIAVLSCLVSTVTYSAGIEELIARGDAAWSRRAEGHDGGQAAAETTAEAIAAYEEAMTLEPENLEARWKFLQALYFHGDYVATDEDAKLDAFTRGRDIAEEGIAQLARTTGKDLGDLSPKEVIAAVQTEPHAAAVYFWSAAHWSLWGLHRGKIAAAREGAGSTMRDYAQITIGLDEYFESAGGHRILGRLHHEAPKIPFFTGWVDRKTAIAELRKAVELTPDFLLNRFYLVEAIFDLDRKARNEGLELLRDLTDREPRTDWLVEDSRVIERAKKLLAEQ